MEALCFNVTYKIAYSKIKKRNLVLINNVTHQRETLLERPIRIPLTMSEFTILFWPHHRLHVYMIIIFAPGSPSGALPLDPTEALNPIRLARVVHFKFLHLCASALNGAPNHPLPTGTRKQSYATGTQQ